MKQKIVSLLATFKTVDAYGLKYAADYPATSLGGQQFALVHAAVAQAGILGATQDSGSEEIDSSVLAKVAGRFHLRTDMLGITDAVHTLVLLGHADMAGKFLMPHSNGDQALLNRARAFATDAVAFQAAFVSVGLAADFITHLTADTDAFETAITTKGTGTGQQSKATGGLEDTAHKASIALHALNTIVRNACKNDPAKLAEWATASHVEKHTPVPNVKPAPAPAATTQK
jgi:hypothetical protein